MQQDRPPSGSFQLSCQHLSDRFHTKQTTTSDHLVKEVHFIAVCQLSRRRKWQQRRRKGPIKLPSTAANGNPCIEITTLIVFSMLTGRICDTFPLYQTNHKVEPECDSCLPQGSRFVFTNLDPPGPLPLCFCCFPTAAHKIQKDESLTDQETLI